MAGEVVELMLNRAWRPALVVTGIYGYRLSTTRRRELLPATVRV